MDEIKKIEVDGVIYDIADLASRADIEELRALIPSGGGGEVPTGTVLAFAGATAPDGFLLCDGTSYPVADYPALYAVIGNVYGGDETAFNVPDYREVALVGVGQNSTNSIATHDVYTLGQFKDDCFQTHQHTINIHKSSSVAYIGLSSYGDFWKTTSTNNASTGRRGNVTRGKRKGVNYVIKA